MEEGAQVGEIRYYLNDEQIRSYPVVTSKNVDKMDFWWCLEQVIGRFFNFKWHCKGALQCHFLMFSIGFLCRVVYNMICLNNQKGEDGMVTTLCIIAILVTALAAIVILRTILFKPLAVDKPMPAKIVADKDRAVRNLSGMIQIPTVSYTDKNLEDIKVFSMFKDFLEKTYPFVHTHCVSIKTGEKGILYHWCGKNAANPVVLMAYYDVVPAQGAWEKPPLAELLKTV